MDFGLTATRWERMRDWKQFAHLLLKELRYQPLPLSSRFASIAEYVTSVREFPETIREHLLNAPPAGWLVLHPNLPAETALWGANLLGLDTENPERWPKQLVSSVSAGLPQLRGERLDMEFAAGNGTAKDRINLRHLGTVIMEPDMPGSIILDQSRPLEERVAMFLRQEEQVPARWLAGLLVRVFPDWIAGKHPDLAGLPVEWQEEAILPLVLTKQIQP